MKGVGASTSQLERFSKPVTEAEIIEKIDGRIPRSTKNCTTWAVNTWRASRIENGADSLSDLEGITNSDLNHWLARFVLEVRGKKGDNYRGGTIYSLCAGIQRHIREGRSKSQTKTD